MHIVGSLLNGPRTEEDYKIKGWQIKDHPRYSQEDSLRAMGEPVIALKKIDDIKDNLDALGIYLTQNSRHKDNVGILDKEVEQVRLRHQSSTRGYEVFVKSRPLFGRVSLPLNKNGFLCYTIDLAKDVYVPNPKYYQQFYKTASKVFGCLAIASTLGFGVLAISTNANQGILIGKISLLVLTAFSSIACYRFSTFSHGAAMAQPDTNEKIEAEKFKRDQTLKYLCKRRDEDFAEGFFGHYTCRSPDGSYSIFNDVIRKEEQELIAQEKEA